MLFSKEKFLAINKLKGKEKTEINLNIKENKLMEKCREYVCKDNKNVQNQWGYNL